jgi:hypothetical protein
MGKLADQAEKFNEEQEKTQALVPQQQSDDPMEALLSPAKVAQIEKVAKMYCGSKLVPDHFRGDLASTFVAMQLAARMQVDPFMLMQNMFVIYGRPGLNAKLIVALFNSKDKRFLDGIKFDIERDDRGKILSCTAWSIRKSDKEKVLGPKIDRELVSGEGWDKPKRRRDGSGAITSKWVTMPEMMFRYRAAAWFVSQHAPEVVLGMPSHDELLDAGEPQEVQVELVDELKENDKEKDVPHDLGKKEEKPKADPEPPKEIDDPPPVDSPDDLTMEKLLSVIDMINMPTPEFERGCNMSGITINDKRTHTQPRLRKLDAYISAYVDQKSQG